MPTVTNYYGSPSAPTPPRVPTARPTVWRSENAGEIVLPSGSFMQKDIPGDMVEIALFKVSPDRAEKIGRITSEPFEVVPAQGEPYKLGAGNQNIPGVYTPKGSIIMRCHRQPE